MTQRPASGPARRSLNATRAEWTKLSSLRSHHLVALGALLLMAAATYQVAVNYATAGPPADAARPAVSGAQVVLLLVVWPTISAVTSEYATGSIHATLLWVPARTTLALAKAVVAAASAFVLGLLLTAVAVLVALGVDPDAYRFSATQTTATALVTSTYLTLASLFTLGIAFMVRNAVGTLIVTTLLLLAVPAALGDSLTPGGAGLSFLTGGPAALDSTSLVVFTSWTGLSLIAGTTIFVRRDS